MANQATDYSQYTSSAGMLGSIFQGLSDLWSAPIPRALPTQPNPGSQVLVSRNAGFVVDPGSPATQYHPEGYAVADLWYDPINPTYATNVSTAWVWDNQRGRYVQQVTSPQQRAPHMYYVKSQTPEAVADALGGKISSQYDNLFRAPEAQVISQNPCNPVASNVAASAAERINRLTQNQFFSPFRARRAGGNSYQALSEPVDDLFDPNGKAGVFRQADFPDFVQSGKSMRLPRR